MSDAGDNKLHQMGTDLVVGIPDFIKEMMGGALPGITHSVVVTYTNKEPAQLVVKCYAEATTTPIDSRTFLMMKGPKVWPENHK